MHNQTPQKHSHTDDGYRHHIGTPTNLTRQAWWPKPWTSQLLSVSRILSLLEGACIVPQLLQSILQGIHTILCHTTHFTQGIKTAVPHLGKTRPAGRWPSMFAVE